MKQKKLPLMGIIFNGDANQSSEQFILDYAQVPCLGRLRQEQTINAATIAKYSNEWRKTFLCRI
jgi:dethiobiotin synthetase